MSETAKKFRLGVLGAKGKMGKEILAWASQLRFSNRIQTIVTHARGETWDPFFQADGWVEFSSPEAVLELCAEAKRRGRTDIPLVVGATGWTNEQFRALEEYGKALPILRSSNFALGIRLCRVLLEFLSKQPEIQDWEVRIREVHHTQKKDAPSGTALSLSETLCIGLGRSTPIESIRESDVFGVHEIQFESQTEKLSLIHEAKSRSVFAEGALEAVLKWLERRLEKSSENLPPQRLLSLDDLYLRREA